MRRLAGPLPALALLALVAAAADAGPKKIVPAQIAQARYVCLGYDLGDGFISEQDSIFAPDMVVPEDRRALEAIRDELDGWGRYVVTLRPHDAELLIAVRTARRAVVSSGIGVGGPGRGTGAYPGNLSGFGGSAEISSPHDTLTVYASNGGRVGAQLWRVQQKGALYGTPPKAWDELRADIERTPLPAKKKP
jgi:hypothetical protein